MLQAHNRYGWSSPSPIFVFQTAEQAARGKENATEHQTREFKLMIKTCAIQEDIYSLKYIKISHLEEIKMFLLYLGSLARSSSKVWTISGARDHQNWDTSSLVSGADVRSVSTYWLLCFSLGGLLAGTVGTV